MLFNISLNIINKNIKIDYKLYHIKLYLFKRVISMNVKASTNDFLKQCKRVLRVARKPDREEYLQFSKVTAIGIAIIGVVGFIFVLVATLVGL